MYTRFMNIRAKDVARTLTSYSGTLVQSGGIANNQGEDLSKEIHSIAFENISTENANFSSHVINNYM